MTGIIFRIDVRRSSSVSWLKQKKIPFINHDNNDWITFENKKMKDHFNKYLIIKYLKKKLSMLNDQKASFIPTN